MNYLNELLPNNWSNLMINYLSAHVILCIFKIGLIYIYSQNFYLHIYRFDENFLNEVFYSRDELTKGKDYLR